MSHEAGEAAGRREAVLRKVSACLQMLAGGSGHLGAYTIDPDTFAITGSRALGEGLTEYRFAARAWLETEFGGPLDESGGGEALPIEGSIVLDASLDLTRDETGAIRIAPWRCLDPERPGGDERRFEAPLF